MNSSTTVSPPQRLQAILLLLLDRYVGMSAIPFLVALQPVDLSSEQEDGDHHIGQEGVDPRIPVPNGPAFEI
ncbi:hypothetical protein [Nitrospira sp. Nam74]